MSQLIHFTCPSCNSLLLYDKDSKDENVSCNACGSEWNVKDLENRPAYNGGASVTGVPSGDALVSYIDDSESALAYLENFFENFDWDEFILTSALSIPAIDKMVEKMLIKAAAKPEAWELQFMSIAKPLYKKLKGLKTLETRFFEEYVKNEDHADSFGYFDTYVRIVNSVTVKAPDLIKTLENAIKYYKKYKGAPAVAEQLSAQLKLIQTELSAVNPVKDYKELSGYKTAQLAKQKAVVDKLAAQGIDAETVYKDAVQSYTTGEDRRKVFSVFNKLSGYKNSEEYVKLLDAWFRFDLTDGIFIRLGQKYYILRKEATFTLNVAALTGKQQQQNVQQPTEDSLNNRTRYSMFEIVAGEPNKKPCLRGITKILAHYGGYLVYLRHNSTLCIFDANVNATVAEDEVIQDEKKGCFGKKDGEETRIEKFGGMEIKKSKPGDFDDVKGNVNFYIRGEYLFITEKLKAVEEKKKGCFGNLLSIFGKGKAEYEVNNNNYSLIAFNLVTGNVNTAIPEMVDIMDIFENEIFFTKAVKIDDEIKEQFYSYNYVTGETRSVLSADTEIVNVIDGKVVYLLWTPNDYNKDLYTLDIKTNETNLLDKNVFDYYKTIDGKVYYTVGNSGYCTLYSINVDGTEKKEVLANARNLGYATERNGWLYTQVGYGWNSVLKKVRATDGKEVLLCSQFKKVVSYSDGYVYYLDTQNRLCTVREDGYGYKAILSDVSEIVKISADAIYLLKKEYIDDNEQSYSLYKVDLSGHNLKKLAFSVNNAAENKASDDEIYLFKRDNVTYAISTPVDKDNYNTTYETRVIKKLMVYNVSTETFTEVAVLGKPDMKNPSTFKGGCFKKSVTKDTIIKEVPNKKTYRRKDKVAAGSVAQEQIRSKTATNQPADGQNQPVADNGNDNAVNGNKPTKKGLIALAASVITYVLLGILFGVTMSTWDGYGVAVAPLVVAIVISVICMSQIAYNRHCMKAAKSAGEPVDKLHIVAIVLNVLCLLSCLGLFISVIVSSIG